MPHFFFHVRTIGRNLSRDELGLDFPDAETAYREAFRAASAIEGEFAARGQSPWDYAIEVVKRRRRVGFCAAIRPGVQPSGCAAAGSPLQA
jgi:hypothetical protein